MKHTGTKRWDIRHQYVLANVAFCRDPCDCNSWWKHIPYLWTGSIGSYVCFHLQNFHVAHPSSTYIQLIHFLTDAITIINSSSLVILFVSNICDWCWFRDGQECRSWILQDHTSSAATEPSMNMPRTYGILHLSNCRRGLFVRTGGDGFRTDGWLQRLFVLSTYLFVAFDLFSM